MAKKGPPEAGSVNLSVRVRRDLGPVPVLRLTIASPAVSTTERMAAACPELMVKVTA